MITQDGRDALVAVSADEFARLSRRDRTVGSAVDRPDAWLYAVLAAEMPVPNIASVRFRKSLGLYGRGGALKKGIED